jgi:hypothetical protein
MGTSLIRQSFWLETGWCSASPIGLENRHNLKTLLFQLVVSALKQTLVGYLKTSRFYTKEIGFMLLNCQINEIPHVTCGATKWFYTELKVSKIIGMTSFEWQI